MNPPDDDFYRLAGRMALNRARPEDFTAWAETLLARGEDSQNLAILASLGLDTQPDSEEIRQYFHRSLRDLGWVLPPEDQALRCYGQSLCRAIINGQLEPLPGARQLAGLYSASHYQPLYMPWGELDEDLDWLQQGQAPLFNPELKHTEAAVFIKRLARQWLELAAVELPDDFDQLQHCQDCGHIGLALQSPYSRWRRWLRLPPPPARCAHCASGRLQSMSRFATRQAWLGKPCTNRELASCVQNGLNRCNQDENVRS